MPAEGDEEEDPDGLRSSVTLMGHQKQALAWLMWREEQQPCGGILADDMGLGKTLTMISLILKHKEMRENKSRDKGGEEKENEWLGKHREFLAISHGTLIVCPASLLGQWEGEIKKRLVPGALNVLVYHGANRGRPAKS